MEEKLLHVSSSPHVRNTRNTTSIMLDVVIALLPASIYGVYHFGWHSALVIIITVLTCVLSEYLWEKALHKKVTIKDLSAVVTGMILALNMPPMIPLWVPVIGGVFAIIIVKQLYGGLGQNFMNPALAARCFLLISFAGLMTNFSCAKIGFDSVTSATPLAMIKAGDLSTSLSDLYLGRIPGTIGEVSTILLLFGALYLWVRDVVTLEVPLSYIATFAVFCLIFKNFDFHYMLCQLCAGGLVFNAFYMANDYVTSPRTPLGEIMYGVLLGIITGIFRLFGASAEGASYAVLLGNMLTPLIDKAAIKIIKKINRRNAFRKEAKA